AESEIARLCEHPRFIRRKDIAIVVVHDHRYPQPRGRLEIDIAGGIWGQHLAQNDASELFTHARAGTIERDDVAQAAFVKLVPCIRAVSQDSTGLRSKAVWTEPSEKDRIKALCKILVDDRLGLLKAAASRSHQR